MIATAAEANPSCFSPGPRRKWQDVVAEYMALALAVDNKWGNTKFLLGQMMPGKSPLYNPMKQAKSYTDLVKLLDLPELAERAKATDPRLGLGGVVADKPAEKLTKAERKALNRAQQEQGKKRSAQEAELESETREAPAARDAIPMQAGVAV